MIPMRFLFVKPQLIGDSLILTSTLKAVKQSYPEAEIWVLVRRGTEDILAGCPYIDQILTISGLSEKKINLRILREGIRDLWRLRRVRFDMVFELSDQHRGRLFASLARAKCCYSVTLLAKINRWERMRFTAQSSFDPEDCHRVESDFYFVSEFLKLQAKTPPALVYERERAEAWPEGGDLAKYCILQIGTQKEYCRWPRERWREIAVYLLEHFDQIVVSTGREIREVEDAVWLRQELGQRVVCTKGSTTWAQVAGLLYHAKLYVGQDTAAMHLAAACECPIVAIFSTTEDRWFPWKGNFRVVLPERYRDINDLVLRREMRREPRMLEITAGNVIESCGQMLHLKSKLN